MNSKIWNRIVIGGISILLVLMGGITIYIDPLFHYHSPLPQYQYPLVDERYQNDGIVRNFQYEALITGSSMCENFKTSEFEQLFGLKTVKTPYAGGGFKEVDDNIRRAIKANDEIKIVLRSIDYTALFSDKNEISTFADDYPDYLYDDNLWNDVHYFLNKDILLQRTYETIRYTHIGGVTTSFDMYKWWSGNYEYGKEAVMGESTRMTVAPVQKTFQEDEQKKMKENIFQNLIETAKNNPQITFYYFFTPYSISYWEMRHQNGEIDFCIDATEFTIEQLLEQSNIQIFGFDDEFDMICDLDNYKDPAHYGEWINSKILYWMKDGEHRLSWENYRIYIDNLRRFYNNYDYAQLY